MRTTNEHFEIFAEKCREWINLLSLGDWDIDILHENNLDMPHALATTEGHLLQHHGIIRFGRSWPKEYLNDEQIKRIALHEVIELMLIELRILAESRFLQPEEIDRSVHTIIQRLTNMLLGGTDEDE
jgi:hypothetical protein